MNKKYQYDVALSFAGENREYVDQVYTYLTTQGIKPFYDKAEEIELWGNDLVARFDGIYRSEAHYCVMFISCHYLQK
ncbi:TIR domain-containing protein, partial [bacterium]|nr:TIR domain-containing protein [bacterium]